MSDQSFNKNLKPKIETKEPPYKKDEIYLSMMESIHNNDYKEIIATIRMIYDDNKTWFSQDFISQINFYEEFIDSEEQKKPEDRNYTKEFTAFAERLVEKFWSIIHPESGPRVEIYWGGHEGE